MPLPLDQIPLKEMEHGLARPVATLKLEPADISERLGIHFEKARDDLDDLVAAVIRSDAGRQFALVRHQHQPKAGTDILINEHVRNVGAVLLDILKSLRLEVRELLWTHPDVKAEVLDQIAKTPRKQRNEIQQSNRTNSRLKKTTLRDKIAEELKRATKQALTEIAKRRQAKRSELPKKGS